MFKYRRRENGVILKTDEEIEKMAAAGKVVSRVLHELEQAVAPGVTTMDLAALASSICKEMGAIPSFLGYRGYPAVLCASVNEQVIHGIPNRIPLKEGDIVGLDFGAILDGYNGDSALTVPVGEVDEEVKRLLKVTEDAMWLGVRMVRPGIKLGDISYAIQRHCEHAGFSVVREMVGHGIGKDMHEEPEVPNYGRKGTGITLKRGMVICIEPMINAGRRDIATLSDDWTIVTQDARPSAHFEHTVAVVPGGMRVLTLRPGQTDR